jgi:uncharacterized phage protein gp47/JayE
VLWNIEDVSSEFHALLAKIPISEQSVIAVEDRRVDAMILLRIVWIANTPFLLVS